jgi:FAD synthase
MYDVDIRVEFLKMTRLETKFDSLEALKEQIARDCAKARAYHNI